MNNELKCPHCGYKISSLKKIKINKILFCKFPLCGKKFIIIKKPKVFFESY
jgi:NAD-dependent SIR2 family protein deacetylase